MPYKNYAISIIPIFNSNVIVIKRYNLTITFLNYGFCRNPSDIITNKIRLVMFGITKLNLVANFHGKLSGVSIFGNLFSANSVIKCQASLYGADRGVLCLLFDGSIKFTELLQLIKNSTGIT